VRAAAATEKLGIRMLYPSFRVGLPAALEEEGATELAAVAAEPAAMVTEAAAVMATPAVAVADPAAVAGAVGRDDAMTPAAAASAQQTRIEMPLPAPPVSPQPAPGLLVQPSAAASGNAPSSAPADRSQGSGAAASGLEQVAGERVAGMATLDQLESELRKAQQPARSLLKEWGLSETDGQLWLSRRPTYFDSYEKAGAAASRLTRGWSDDFACTPGVYIDGATLQVGLRLPGVPTTLKAQLDAARHVERKVKAGKKSYVKQNVLGVSNDARAYTSWARGELGVGSFLQGKASSLVP